MKFACAPETRPLPGYTVKRAIDRGAFGEVYYGVSDGGKEVALKLLHENPQSELRGVSQCLNLKHPNLVALFDIKSDEQGDWWVVMEYIRGGSLEQRLAESPQGLPVDEVGEWLRGLCAGVDYLHAQKIVHRDLKPGNVFREGATVKIGDVGLAKFMAPSRRSAQTESVGTVYYMAPEVAHGRYGREVDLYSLGVMLYEMLTGQLPFDGESTGEILMKHLTQAPDLARIPVPLRPVLARVLEKDPVKRTGTAGQLWTEFQSATAGRSRETPVTGETRVPDPRRTAEPPVAIPVSALPPPARREPPVGPVAAGVDADAAPLVSNRLFGGVLLAMAILAVVQRAPWTVKLRELFLLGAIAVGWKVLTWWALPEAERPAVWKRADRSLRRWAGWNFFHLYLRCVMVLWVLAYVSLRVTGMAEFGGVFGVTLFWGFFVAATIRYVWGGGEPESRPVAMVPPPTPARVQVPAAPVPMVPPPLPAAARRTPYSAAPSPGLSGVREGSRSSTVGDLLLSMARAGALVPMAVAALFFGLPEWDRTWQPMQRDELAIFFGASALVATWGILVGAWFVNRPGPARERPRVALVVLGLAIGALIGQWHQWLDIDLAFRGASHAMFQRIGSHSLTDAGQPTPLGYAVYFGLLFGARSWWESLAANRPERWSGWQASWVAVMGGLVIPIVVAFPNVWGGLWGATLGLALPLAATWRPRPQS